MKYLGLALILAACGVSSENSNSRISESAAASNPSQSANQETHGEPRGAGDTEIVATNTEYSELATATETEKEAEPDAGIDTQAATETATPTETGQIPDTGTAEPIAGIPGTGGTITTAPATTPSTADPANSDNPWPTDPQSTPTAVTINPPHQAQLLSKLLVSADGDESVTAVLDDPSGNSYIAGDFSGSLTLPGAPNNVVFQSPSGITHAFVAKYDAQGAFVWAAHIGSDTQSHVTGLAFSNTAHLGVIGYYAGSFDFDRCFPNDIGSCHGCVEEPHRHWWHWQ